MPKSLCNFLKRRTYALVLTLPLILTGCQSTAAKSTIGVAVCSEIFPIGIMGPGTGIIAGLALSELTNDYGTKTSWEIERENPRKPAFTEAEWDADLRNSYSKLIEIIYGNNETEQNARYSVVSDSIVDLTNEYFRNHINYTINALETIMYKEADEDNNGITTKEEFEKYRQKHDGPLLDKLLIYPSYPNS